MEHMMAVLMKAFNYQIPNHLTENVYFQRDRPQKVARQATSLQKR